MVIVGKLFVGDIVIKKCSNNKCESSFQDEKYGKGNRVQNPMQKKGTKVTYRCTVCGTVS